MKLTCSPSSMWRLEWHMKFSSRMRAIVPAIAAPRRRSRDGRKIWGFSEGFEGFFFLRVGLLGGFVGVVGGSVGGRKPAKTAECEGWRIGIPIPRLVRAFRLASRVCFKLDGPARFAAPIYNSLVQHVLFVSY
jgi:hypothetical protein